jgi:formylglycine-generating enzyme required for sulfatase activity
MSATEVTVGQFKKFSATGFVTQAEKAATSSAPNSVQTYLSPGYSVTDACPAAVITWHDAVAYCQWLSSQEKRTYRLPTEAEWEYACRAGTTTQYSFGDDHNELSKYGWYNKKPEPDWVNGKSHPVAGLLPNPFGLFDMHGNLWEWCGDSFDEKWYEKSPPGDPVGPAADLDRVLRGGACLDIASRSRSAYRHDRSPYSAANTHGFRCVMEW